MAVNRQAREGYKHALQNLLLHAKKGLPIHLVDVSESAYFECTAEVQQVLKIPIPSKAVLVTTRRHEIRHASLLDHIANMWLCLVV